MGRHHKGILAVLLGIAIALIAVGPFASLSLASGCDETWASTSSSGNWSTAAAWSPASVPTSTQNVCLPAGSYTVTLTGSQSAASVSVGTGVTLAVTISSGNGAALTLGNNGSSTNSGTIDLTDTDTSGTGSPAATLQLDTGATLTNDGTIVSDTGAGGPGTRQILAQATSSTLDNASDGTITVNRDLLLDSQGSGTFTTSGAVTIASGQKLLVGSAGGGTMNITGGTITNHGTFEQGVSEAGPTGDGTLDVTGGTVTGAGLVTALPSSLSFNGQGSGTYTVEGVKGATCGGPCSLSGTIGSGQTLVESASNANGPAYLVADSNVTNDGTIELTDPDTTGASQEADLAIASGQTLTNGGTIISDPGGHGLGINELGGAGTTGTLDNAANGTITVNQDLQIDSQQSGLFETSGNITIASGEKLLADPAGAGLGGSPPKESAEMDINGGTITDNGAFEQGLTEAGSIGGAAALKVNGGTITGAGLKAVSGAASDLAGSGEGAAFSGSGTGTYTFVGSLSANSTTLGGTIGANQTVVLSASTADGAVPVQLNSNVTNDGTIELTDSDTSGANQNAAVIQIDTGDTLTNNGTITSLPGSIGAGQRVINGQTATAVLNNATGGTISAQQDLQIDNGQQGTFTTTGTITVPSGGTLQLDPNGGSTFVNLNGGTVTNNGTAEIGINSGGNSASGATFDVNGGTVSGNPMIAAVADTTFSGSGSGSFMLEGATSIFGGGTIAGTIGANDNVTVSGTTGASGSAAVTASGTVVNNGTFTLADPDSGASTSAFAELEIPSSASFTNDGTFVSGPGPAGSGYRSIDGTLNNAGTLEINMLLQLGLHSASAIDNSGTVDIGSGQAVMDSGAYDQSAGTTSLGAGSDLSVPSLLVGGGQVTGSGTICGPGGSQAAPCGSGSSATSLVNGGTIAPSPTPSTLTVQGDYTQSSTGTLAVGVNASGNDQLRVTGSGDAAALDGTLQVSTASGFTPATGTVYDVLNAPGGVSGTFASTSGTGPYTIAYNAGDVTLTAAAVTPAASFNPTSLVFGSASNTIAAGTTSSQMLTITDSGHAPLVLGALALGGSDAAAFSLSADGCSGQTVQAGASCTATINFAPTAAGTDSAQLTVPDNAAGSPQQVTLTGYAGAAGARATFSPSSVDFGTVGVGVPAGMTVTVQSTGTAALGIAHVSLGGADAGDYAISSDTCSGATLAAGGSCSIGLTLTASAPGTRQASLSLADNAPGSPQSVSLSGSASATGTLTGTVTTNVAGNPLPLPGSAVDLCTHNATSDTGCRSVSTSASGRYTFTGIAPGSYRMEAHPPKPSLQPGSAVLQVLAGPNTQDFTLHAPQPIPAGVSINGYSGGTASSFWTMPDVIDVPLSAESKGMPGEYGVTVTTFAAQPYGGNPSVAPRSFGTLQVEYRFDSAGIPRLVAIDTTEDNVPSLSLGSWMTSLAGSVSAGQDVRGLTVQGVFDPASTTPVHGEFVYAVTHYVEYGTGLAAAAARARAAASPVGGSVAHQGGNRVAHQGSNRVAHQGSNRVAHQGSNRVAHQGGNRVAHQNGGGPSTGPPPVGDLVGESPNPDLASCTPQPTWNPDADEWTLPDGETIFEGPGGLAGPTILRPNGTSISITKTPQGIQIDVEGNAPGLPPGLGGPAHYTVWDSNSGFGDLQALEALTGGPTVAEILNAYGIKVGPGGQYVLDEGPGGPGYPEYQINSDGSWTDLKTGTVYAPDGTIQSQGKDNCDPNPPPNDPNDPYQWAEQIFDYKDPSGTVLTTSKIPVAGAKVVLERAAHAKGPFKPVRNGSLVMSPSNRRNPDHTTALGGFGWDVIDGFYRITAQHASCRAASGGGSVTHTRVLPVPPPVTGLRLLLRCPHLTRAKTHVTLKARRMPVGEVMLTATVRAGHRHRAAGLVEFTLGGRHLGYVPLLPRRSEVVMSVTGKSTRGYRARYLGDGYNAPSSGRS